MGKASSRKKRQHEPDPGHLPTGVSRCSRCGRPWITEQMRPIKNDVLCFPCSEEFDMAKAQALHEAAEAERLIQVERQKHARLN